MAGAKLRWGILGTGGIANKFAEGIAGSHTGVLTAVGSRSLESARQFCAKHPCKPHASYEALLADPDVEIVYISTPHPFHAEWCIKAAQAGKHVLCEKPLAMNEREARTMVEAARANNVFLMEAFMYRCHPQTHRIVELVREGVLGRVGLLQASFSFQAPSRPERLLDRALGGGAILDLGCYCVSMARLVAGACSNRSFDEPEELVAVGNIGETTHVDMFSVATLKFRNGMLAQLVAGMDMQLENNVRIVGSNGTLLVPMPWCPAREGGFSKILLFRDNIPEEIVIECDRGIYALEADTAAEHLSSKQAPVMSWEDSLGNMRALDRWRSEVGMSYESDV